MNEWSFVVGALIGSVAWFYQKAWERRIQRTAVYEKIVRLLPSVTFLRHTHDRKSISSR